MLVGQRVFFFFLLTATVFAESNTSTIISGGYSNAPAGVIVGFTGTNNTLTINSGGVLNTTNISAIGVMTNANFNSATVTGTGSTWSSGAGFYIGAYSSFNRLILSAGGQMIVSNTALLAMFPESSSNSMLITGSGSAFVQAGTKEFDIGFAGSDNSVTVSNSGKLSAREIVVGQQETAEGNSLLVYGGMVTSDWFYVGDDGGFSNRVLLTGASSLLYASNTFACGVWGRASRVEILNGAHIESGTGRIGWEVGGNSNLVVVSGAGSTWSNRNEFDLGLRGSFNTLVISNGGTVWTGGWNPIGMETSSVGNTAIVTGPGSSWVITNVFLIGQAGSSNRLEIRNGATVSNGWFAYISDSSNSHGNSVLVTGTNSRWVSQSTLWMGEDSGGNRLDIHDGAFLSASNVYVGMGFSSWTGNVIDVSGPGTIWTNTGMVYISGYGNTCTINNGPTVYSAELRASGDDSNAPVHVILDGTNTQWFCAGRVVAGLSSSYGFIGVTNGARLFSAAGMIGQEGNDEHNAVVVSGQGSVWSNSGSLCVGRSGDYGSLTVERGGNVFCSDASVGSYILGVHNSARVAGSNSAWHCAGTLWVGYSQENSLRIEEGAAFSCTSAVVGVGMSNELVVTGTGSAWSNGGNLVIGSGTSADFNQFVVSSGAFACTESATLAEEKGSYGYILVTGPGSTWSNASSLEIGRTGRYNRLVVENGARLFSGAATLGIATASVGNAACVSGAGTTWRNAGALIVGQGGADNSLTIGGATVEAGSVTIGALGTARACFIELQTGTLAAASTVTINTNSELRGCGTVSAATLNNHGLIQVGNPIGSITGQATFVMWDSGALHFELGGPVAGQSHDQLALSAGLAVGGTLRVERVRGFVPEPGEAFKLISCGPITGSGFAATNLPPWFTWSVSYQQDAGVFLTVTGVETATNGVPKAWLADHGWTNAFDAAATNDIDDDRMATWEEYYAGTDPTNGTSFFQCLEISSKNLPTLGKILRWNAVTDRVYSIDGSTNLIEPWFELATNLPPVGVWTDTTHGADQLINYRLGVERP